MQNALSSVFCSSLTYSLGSKQPGLWLVRGNGVVEVRLQTVRSKKQQAFALNAFTL